MGLDNEVGVVDHTQIIAFVVNDNHFHNFKATDTIFFRIDDEGHEF